MPDIADPQPAPPTPLAEAIQLLRKELTAAIKSGEKESLRFELGEIEMELKVTASNERGAKGDMKFWVLSVGGDKKSGASVTHTVRLKLKPKGRDGNVVTHVSRTTRASDE